MDAWATHTWLDASGRCLNLKGQWKKEYFCIRCKRHFVELVGTGECIAVFPSAFDFDPLAPDITARWLNETCPGEQQQADIEVYRDRAQSRTARNSA
jgi:hypothetical protein